MHASKRHTENLISVYSSIVVLNLFSHAFSWIFSFDYKTIFWDWIWTVTVLYLKGTFLKQNLWNLNLFVKLYSCCNWVAILQSCKMNFNLILKIQITVKPVCNDHPRDSRWSLLKILISLDFLEGARALL
jgi:hypothetical protein